MRRKECDGLWPHQFVREIELTPTILPEEPVYKSGQEKRRERRAKQIKKWKKTKNIN